MAIVDIYWTGHEDGDGMNDANFAYEDGSAAFAPGGENDPGVSVRVRLHLDGEHMTGAKAPVSSGSNPVCIEEHGIRVEANYWTESGATELVVVQNTSWQDAVEKSYVRGAGRLKWSGNTVPELFPILLEGTFTLYPDESLMRGHFQVCGEVTIDASGGWAGSDDPADTVFWLMESQASVKLAPGGAYNAEEAYTSLYTVKLHADAINDALPAEGLVLANDPSTGDPVTYGIGGEKTGTCALALQSAVADLQDTLDGLATVEEVGDEVWDVHTPRTTT